MVSESGELTYNDKKRPEGQKNQEKRRTPKNTQKRGREAATKSGWKVNEGGQANVKKVDESKQRKRRKSTTAERKGTTTNAKRQTRKDHQSRKSTQQRRNKST
jgi:hypothetical protein